MVYVLLDKKEVLGVYDETESNEKDNYVREYTRRTGRKVKVVNRLVNNPIPIPLNVAISSTSTT